MNKYRELLLKVIEAFPQATNVKIIIDTSIQGAREFQEAVLKETETCNLIWNDDVAVNRDGSPVSTCFTSITIPLYGSIELNIKK